MDRERKLTIAALVAMGVLAVLAAVYISAERQAPIPRSGPYAFLHGYDGENWTPWEPSYEGTAIATGSYTSTQNSSDITNTFASGVMLTLDVDAIADSPQITLSVAAKGPNGNYEKLLDADTGVTGAGVHSYQIYPANLTAVDDVVEVSDLALPRNWRVTVSHMDTDAITYTVSYMYLQ